MEHINDLIKQILRPIIQESVRSALHDAIKHQKPTNEDEVGGIDLAMKVTGLAKQTIYGLVSNGKIPYYKKGAKLYFKKKELVGWIELGKAKTESQLIDSINSYNRKRRT